MAYLPPMMAILPKNTKLLQIALDEGANGCSYALLHMAGRAGVHNDTYVWVHRWNGNDEDCVGLPRIRAKPYWHILDSRLVSQVKAIIAEKNPQAMARIQVIERSHEIISESQPPAALHKPKNVSALQVISSTPAPADATEKELQDHITRLLSGNSNP